MTKIKSTAKEAKAMRDELVAQRKRINYLELENVVRIENLKRVDIQPGDVFVLQTEMLLTKEQVDMIRRGCVEQLRDAFGHEVKVLIFTAGIEAGIMRAIGEGVTQ
jgi:hypothetical protein